MGRPLVSPDWIPFVEHVTLSLAHRHYETFDEFELDDSGNVARLVAQPLGIFQPKP